MAAASPTAETSEPTVATESLPQERSALQKVKDIADAAAATSASTASVSSPPHSGGDDDAPAACEALHAAEGFCEILHLSSDGRSMLSAGWDGKLASVNTAVKPPVRAFMVPIAGKGGMLTAAAVSPDAGWLALSQEYSNGFGVWVCPLDGKLAPCLERLKLVARFTLPVRHLVWHSSRPLLGIATDDGKLLMWDRDTGKRRDFHTGSSGGSVRCLAFDPRGELLAAALASGALVVFGLEGGEEKYRGSAWRKNVVPSERLRMVWRPDGSMLALPGTTAVRLVARGTYAQTEIILEGGHRYPTSAAAWSPDGSLLATASLEAVALWRPPFLLKVCRVAAAPHSLMWCGADTLAIGTVAGSWVHIAVDPSIDPLGSHEGPTTEATQESVEVKTMADGCAPSEEPLLSQVEEPVAVAALPLHQSAFQPGATIDLEPRRRYLAFNEHGALKLHLPDAGAAQRAQQAGRIEVEHSRLRFRSSLRQVKAPEGVVMGALGLGAFALATAPNPESGQAAKVIVHVAASTGKSSSETVLPTGEEVRSLAIGKTFVAALTSKSNLHVQSLSGEHLDMLALTGSPVSLVACGDLLLCISHSNFPEEPMAELSMQEKSAQERHLEYFLYGVTAKERLAEGQLPLSEAASLRWCGFSAEALPLALDSNGVLRALSHSGVVREWVSVAELPAAGQRLWPVRAEGSSLFCVELSKGAVEPRVGAVQKFLSVRYQRPKPAEDSTVKHSDSLYKGALTDFEVAAKVGDVEEALDVILRYFEVYGARLIMDAHSLSLGLGQDALAQRLESVLAAASGIPQEEEPVQEASEDATSGKDKRQEDEEMLETQQNTQMDQALQAAVEPPLEAPTSATQSLAPELPATSSAAAFSTPMKELSPDAAHRIADSRAKALERKAAVAAASMAEIDVSFHAASAPVAGAGLDPEVARRIAANRAQALERKAAATRAAEKRPRSPSSQTGASLQEAPSALRLRSF